MSPIFPKIVIHLKAPYPGKTFTIETSPDPGTTPYIQSVKLNGQDHPKNWIAYQDITKGGTLHTALGPKPNRSWGSAPADAPPSLSQQQP